MAAHSFSKFARTTSSDIRFTPESSRPHYRSNYHIGVEYMTEKVPCSSCDAMVLPSTFEKNDGLCAQCAKLVENPPSQPPSAVAFRLAATFLALNAAITVYVALTSETVGIITLSALVDTILAILLVRAHEGARLLTIIRAILGFVAVSVASFLAGDSQPQWFPLFSQGVFSAGILVLMVGETTPPKLWISSICLAIIALIYGSIISVIATA